MVVSQSRLALNEPKAARAPGCTVRPVRPRSSTYKRPKKQVSPKSADVGMTTEPRVRARCSRSAELPTTKSSRGSGGAVHPTGPARAVAAPSTSVGGKQAGQHPPRDHPRKAAMARPSGRARARRGGGRGSQPIPSMAPHTQRTRSVFQTDSPAPGSLSAPWSSLPSHQARPRAACRDEERPARRGRRRASSTTAVYSSASASPPPTVWSRQGREQEADEVAARITEEDRGLRGVQDEEAAAGCRPR